jgi:hypothetical protein
LQLQISGLGATNRSRDGRPHRSPDLDPPVPAPLATVTTPPITGRVERIDILDGLIHEYHRAA